MPIAKEQLRQIIADSDNNSANDIYALFKESFKGMLQELMEAEMNASIGYEKNNKENVVSDSKRNGYSSRLLKHSMEKFL